MPRVRGSYLGWKLRPSEERAFRLFALRPIDGIINQRLNTVGKLSRESRAHRISHPLYRGYLDRKARDSPSPDFLIVYEILFCGRAPSFALALANSSCPCLGAPPHFCRFGRNSRYRTSPSLQVLPSLLFQSVACGVQNHCLHQTWHGPSIGVYEGRRATPESANSFGYVALEPD